MRTAGKSPKKRPKTAQATTRGKLPAGETRMVVVGLKFMHKELEVFGEVVAAGTSSRDQTLDFVRRMRAYLDVLEELEK